MKLMDRRMYSRKKVITNRRTYFFLLPLFLLVTLLSCFQEKQAFAEESSIDESAFELVQHKLRKVFDSKDSIVYDITNIGVDQVRLTLLVENTRSLLKIGNTRMELEFNYFYDMDLEDGLSRIKIFKDTKSTDVVMFFPTFTEEYPTYEIVKFDGLKDRFMNGGITLESFDRLSFESAVLTYKMDECVLTFGDLSFSSKLDDFSADRLNPKLGDEHADRDQAAIESIAGEWNLKCELEFMEFSIDPDGSVFISLESSNRIFISGMLKMNAENSGTETYELFFDRVESKEDYYNEPVINEAKISKDRSIAVLKVLGENSMELNWLGLVNAATGKREFVENFVFVKENDGSNLISLKRCQ